MSPSVDEKAVSTPALDTVTKQTSNDIMSGQFKEEYDNTKTEVFVFGDADPVLDRKMHLLNNAIDEIGWTNYHLKLFFLTGFGYSVDTIMIVLQSLAAGQIAKEFQPTLSRSLTIALYIGLFVGALFWGFLSDIIGRRLSFNTSLLISAAFTIIGGSAPNWVAIASFVSLAAFGSGGNLVLDVTVFLEFLPSSKQWLLTVLAGFWGTGQLTGGLLAWAFLGNFSCETSDNCTKENNYGWRYLFFTAGALVLVMCILRVTVINLEETPKYLLGKNRDEEVVQHLQNIATKYNRPCSLTAEQLRACGTLASEQNGEMSLFQTLTVHIRGLFVTKKLGISTVLLWASWMLVGLAFPLYIVFLPEYLMSRGADFGDGSIYTTYRDYSIASACSILGPVVGGYLCNTPRVGRKGTMFLGAITTAIFFFAYTQVRTPAQNLGINCALNVTLNVYYAALYAYTPEVLPSAHRATGSGISVALNRIMGIVAALVGQYANTATSIPIWICGAVFIMIAGISAVFPFEPLSRRSA